MSGPSCKTCDHYFPYPLGDGLGECTDPTKAIFYKYGDRQNGETIVSENLECRNHKTKPKESVDE